MSSKFETEVKLRSMFRMKAAKETCRQHAMPATSNSLKWGSWWHDSLVPALAEFIYKLHTGKAPVTSLSSTQIEHN